MPWTIEGARTAAQTRKRCPHCGARIRPCNMQRHILSRHNVATSENRRILPPAPNPCGSCPYRRDVPSGVWDEEEYAKLPDYDGPTFDQPPSVFLCHQQDGRLCAGWTACHDMNENLGLRFAAGYDMIDAETFRAALDYSTPVPIFASGAEAAAHGRAEIRAPGDRAAKTIDKLIRRRSR